VTSGAYGRTIIKVGGRAEQNAGTHDGLSKALTHLEERKSMHGGLQYIRIATDMLSTIAPDSYRCNPWYNPGTDRGFPDQNSSTHPDIYLVYNFVYF
jgi:hypothetical protein